MRTSDNQGFDLCYKLTLVCSNFLDIRLFMIHMMNHLTEHIQHMKQKIKHCVNYQDN